MSRKRRVYFHWETGILLGKLYIQNIYFRTTIYLLKDINPDGLNSAIFLCVIGEIY